MIFIKLNRDFVEAARAGDYSKEELAELADVFNRYGVKAKPSVAKILTIEDDYADEMYVSRLSGKVCASLQKDLRKCRAVAAVEAFRRIP
jgi:hypothetical protein